MSTKHVMKGKQLATIIARSKRGQKKRSNNRQASTELLEEQRIDFDSKNGGAHLIVQGTTGLIDFWPGTGRWVGRSGFKEGFGVKRLIEHIKTALI